MKKGVKNGINYVNNANNALCVSVSYEAESFACASRYSEGAYYFYFCRESK